MFVRKCRSPGRERGGRESARGRRRRWLRFIRPGWRLWDGRCGRRGQAPRLRPGFPLPPSSRPTPEPLASLPGSPWEGRGSLVCLRCPGGRAAASTADAPPAPLAMATTPDRPPFGIVRFVIGESDLPIAAMMLLKEREPDLPGGYRRLFGFRGSNVINKDLQAWLKAT